VYKHKFNKFIPFVDDITARWTTSVSMVDYDSVAGGDKFGNVWIVRCPKKTSSEADEPSSESSLISRQYLNGSPNRLDLMAHFFTQDVPTSICKTNLIIGGQDVLPWSGLQGPIGVLIPFVSREDVDFFHTLEAHMRSEDPPLAGRDHLMYRGYYAPVMA
jgi:splicing factor 3B subunit 3